MAAIAYTKRVLVQRIRKEVSNSQFISDDFQASDNEILLLIDSMAATKIVGNTFNGAKVEGALVVPEAYYITYLLPALVKDINSGYWTTTLPQPPMSLPIGYSIDRVYFAASSFGQSWDSVVIKAKRVGRREQMPKMPGTRHWVEGNTLWMAAADGGSLSGLNLYARMATARTTDLDAVMNMPEDDVSFVFDEVVKRLLQRYGVPQDVIVDDIGAGNKSS